MKKENFKGIASHHGDVQCYELNELPSDCVKIEPQFIAKSEKSGHVHVLCGEYEMFTKPDVDGFFIKVGTDGCTLNHTGLANLTPEIMKKNIVTPIADHKPNFYKPNTILFIGIQKRKKHFSKVWENVKD
jgi:hypothetical protein